jgi:mono/diheme cytochrome c family protein
MDLKTGIIAPPVSYTVNGVQYIALLAGWGGTGGLSDIPDARAAVMKYHTNQGRLFVFKLGGKQAVKALAPEGVPPEEPPPFKATPAQLNHGFAEFARTCTVCHGFFAQSEQVVPDLRLMPRATWSQFDDIVRGGALADGGMASFKDILSKQDVADIRAYVLQQAHMAWDAAHPKKAKAKGGTR